jgi:hypothetical protein
LYICFFEGQAGQSYILGKTSPRTFYLIAISPWAQDTTGLPAAYKDGRLRGFMLYCCHEVADYRGEALPMPNFTENSKFGKD